MEDLGFRKFLTTYGISYNEYQKLFENEKQELQEKFNLEQKNNKSQEKANTVKSFGDGMQGCGCSLMLIPIVIISLIIIYAIIAS